MKKEFCHTCLVLASFISNHCNFVGVIREWKLPISSTNLGKCNLIFSYRGTIADQLLVGFGAASSKESTGCYEHFGAIKHSVEAYWEAESCWQMDQVCRHGFYYHHRYCVLEVDEVIPASLCIESLLHILFKEDNVARCWRNWKIWSTVDLDLVPMYSSKD